MVGGSVRFVDQQFLDWNDGNAGGVSVRNAGGAIGLTLSLTHEADIAILISPEQARAVAALLDDAADGSMVNNFVEAEDQDTGDAGGVNVRNADGAVGLTIYLRRGGDLAVFMSSEQAREVTALLLGAAAEGSG